MSEAVGSAGASDREHAETGEEAASGAGAGMSVGASGTMLHAAGQAVPDPDFVQSLARGLATIKAFDGEHASLTLSEVSRRAEIPPAAARRFLRTLATLGYVRTEGKQFALTPKVLELGFGYLSSLTLPEIAQPHLEKLSAQTGESVSAAVLSGTEVVYVARVPTRRIMSVGITIGTRFPAASTSMGRVLLAAQPGADLVAQLAALPQQQVTPRTKTDLRDLRAELDLVGEQGWAIVDGELEVGLLSVAVPVRDRDGDVVAAINVSTSATRDTAERLREFHLPLALATARDIEREMPR